MQAGISEFMLSFHFLKQNCPVERPGNFVFFTKALEPFLNSNVFRSSEIPADLFY